MIQLSWTASAAALLVLSGCNPLSGTPPGVIFDAGHAPGWSEMGPTSAPIASLVFTTAPSTPVTADATNSVVIEAYDANAALITDDSQSVITLTGHASADCSGAAVSSGLSHASVTLSGGTGTVNLGLRKIAVQSVKATSGSVTVCSGPVVVPHGALASFAFTTQPAAGASVDVQLGTQPVVTAYDAYGNVQTSYVGTVTLAANSNASACGVVSDVASGMSGDTQVAVAGVATFTTARALKTNAVRLRAYDGAAQGCSNTFSLSPGAAASVAWGTAPATTYTASNSAAMTPFTARLVDGNGNTIISNNSTTISVDRTTGTAALGGTTSRTVVAGVATFNDITYTKAETLVITATENDGGATVASSNITVSAGAYSAAQSVVTRSAATVASAGTVTVTLTTKDAYGNTNPTGLPALGAIVFTVTGTGTGTYSSQSAAGSGVYTATFTGAIAGAATLGATISTVAAGTTAAITVTPSTTVASIAWVTAPATTYTASNAAAMTTFTAKVLDAAGNTITSDNATTITVARSTGTGALGGTTTRTAASGIVTFNDITYTKAESLVITGTSSPGSFTVTSSSITVSADTTIASIGWDTAPATPYAASSTVAMTTFKVKLLDAYSNVITSNNATTATISRTTGTGSLGGTLTRTAASGLISFNDITYTKAETMVITATVGAFTVASGNIVVTPSTTVASIGWATAPSLSYNASATTPMTTFTVELLDAHGNRVTTNSTTTATVARTTGTATLGGTTTRTAASGLITFDDITYNTSETMTLTATSGSFSVVSGSIVVGVFGDTVDDDNTATGFAGGTFSGVSAYATLTGESSSSGLQLGNNGGCNGTTTACSQASIPSIYELNQSWAPRWNNIVGLWHINENAGTTTIADSKGGHTGTLAGSGMWTSGATGKMGTALKTQYTTGNWSTNRSVFSVPDHADHKPTSISMSVWIYPTAQSSWGAIALKNTGNNGYGLVNVATSGSDVVSMYINGWANHASISVFMNTWTHIVGTYDGTHIKIYKNGKLATTTAYNTGLTNVATALEIGNDSGGNYYGWEGSMDELAMWNVALTPSEVAAIYNRQYQLYSGTFVSRIMDALINAQWDTLSWLPTLPFMKALPDYSGGAIQNETSSSTQYKSLASSTLMSSIAGLWHLDESLTATAPATSISAGGADYADTSGGSSHGTISGGVVQGGPGRLSNAPAFNGTSGFLRIPNDAAINSLTTLTASAWVRSNAANTGTQIAFSSNDGGGKGIMLGLVNGAPSAWSNSGYVSSGGALTDARWHHIAATWNSTGNAVEVYLDGASVTTGTRAVNGSSTLENQIGAMCTGAASTTCSNYFNGDVDEVAVWGRVLTATEIKQLYLRGASRLKFQVRSCTEVTCVTGSPAWQGPDGSDTTFFSELNNMSTQASTPSGTVNTALPSMALPNYTSPISTNQFIQYRTIFESDSSTAANMPELKKVTAGGH